MQHNGSSCFEGKRCFGRPLETSKKQDMDRLGYHCPHCQHESCTVCNDKEGCTQCPRCRTPFPHMNPVQRQSMLPCPRTLLGRTCKSCRTFYEIENSVGAKWSRRSSVTCPKCQSEKDQAKATGERGNQKNVQRKKAARTLDTSNPRRSERTS